MVDESCSHKTRFQWLNNRMLSLYIQLFQCPKKELNTVSSQHLLGCDTNQPEDGGSMDLWNAGILTTTLHSITNQKTWTSIFIVMKTSNLTTEFCSQMLGNSASYSRIPTLEFQLRNRLIWLKLFVVFLSTSGKCWNHTLKQATTTAFTSFPIHNSQSFCHYITCIVDKMSLNSSRSLKRLLCTCTFQYH